jgi:hypothetical protein
MMLPDKPVEVEKPITAEINPAAREEDVALRSQIHFFQRKKANDPIPVSSIMTIAPQKPISEPTKSGHTFF